MIKTRLGMGLLVGIMLALGACSMNGANTNEDKYKQVIESDSSSLSRNLSVSDVKIGESGDLLRAQVTIRNESRSGVNFKYKFKWLDKNGFEVAVGGRPWQPLSIMHYKTKSIQAVAPNPSVKDFKILVQE